MTLTEFLLARIAEDEAAAERGGSHNGGGTFANDNYGCLLVQPTRVLAECESKRRILTVHRDASLDEEGQPEKYMGSTATGYCRGCNADFTEEWAELLEECPTLRALAMPYADHAEFRAEWGAL